MRAYLKRNPTIFNGNYHRCQLPGPGTPKFRHQDHARCIAPTAPGTHGRRVKGTPGNYPHATEDRIED